MPLLRRRFAVAVKHETTPGTAESLAVGDLIPNVFDAEINPDITMEDRPAAGPGIGHYSSTVSGHRGMCRFTVELTAENSPLWASRILPALGFSETTGTYTPESLPPEAAGSGAETVTVGVYRDGVLKTIRGAMGTGVFRITSGGRALLEVEFTGIWQAPSNVAILTPTQLTPIRAANGDITIGTFVPKFAEMTIDLNNEVTLREDVDDVSGFCNAVISSRRPTGTINAESTLTGTHGASVWDVYQDMLDRTTRELDLSVGGYDFVAPAIQLIGPSEGDRNNVQIDDVEFLLTQDSDAGDDELSISVPTA